MLANVKNQVQLIITSPVFMSMVTSWFCAQFVKTVIKLATGKISDIRELFGFLLWRTGGMPSSHSACVLSVSTSIGFRSGFDSSVFILSLCLALVVVRDALGVRRSSGTQARAINEIGAELDRKNVLLFKPIKEVQGHRPIEVIVGCFLGFFIGLAFSIL
jgi:acid phosphatase family membrane protein YuiD